MNTGVCKGLDTRLWKDLYQAALFESDLDTLPQRLAEAETAVVTRARELSLCPEDDNLEERERLEWALCNLRAFGHSVKRGPTAIQRTRDLKYLRRTSA